METQEQTQTEQIEFGGETMETGTLTIDQFDPILLAKLKKWQEVLLTLDAETLATLAGIEDNDFTHNYPIIDRVRQAQDYLKELDEFGNIQNGNRYACPLIIATMLGREFLRKLTLKEFMLTAMDTACDKLNIGRTVAEG